MKKRNTLEKIKNGLIVSCQARKGWPMYGTDIMVAFANAATQGGAVGIRATEPENIKAIKQEVDLPLIGIYKQWYEGYQVYITPTYQSAKEVAEAGAEIIALDGTDRKRPGDEKLNEIISEIHKNFPDILVMADCDSVLSAKYSEKCGADIVSTTLAGYTDRTKIQNKFDKNLVEEMHTKVKVPVIAEGHISNIEDLRDAFEHGAYSAVIGTAITRPEVITKTFINALK